MRLMLLSLSRGYIIFNSSIHSEMGTKEVMVVVVSDQEWCQIHCHCHPSWYKNGENLKYYNLKYSHSRMHNLVAHLIVIWNVNMNFLQLFNWFEKLVPFGTITWSGEYRELRLAIHPVTIKDASDLENGHVEHDQVLCICIGTYCSGGKR